MILYYLCSTYLLLNDASLSRALNEGVAVLREGSGEKRGFRVLNCPVYPSMVQTQTSSQAVCGTMYHRRISFTFSKDHLEGEIREILQVCRIFLKKNLYLQSYFQSILSFLKATFLTLIPHIDNRS